MDRALRTGLARPQFPMKKPLTLSSLQQEGHPSAAKVRLTICLLFYGASLGIAGMLISFLARTKFPIDPTHLDFQTTVILTPAGAVAGAFLGGLMAWVTTHREGRPHGLLMWAVMGFLFGVLLSFVTGVFLPYSTAALNIAKGVSESGNLVRDLVDAAFRMPSVAVIQGVFGLFTGMLMGAFFMFGGILIERVNISAKGLQSRYLAYVITLALSVISVAIAAFGPADLLAKLG